MTYPPKSVREAMKYAQNPLCPECGQLGKEQPFVFGALKFLCGCGHDWVVGTDHSAYVEYNQ